MITSEKMTLKRGLKYRSNPDELMILFAALATLHRRVTDRLYLISAK